MYLFVQDEEIQELKKRNDELEKQISTLQSHIEKQKGILNRCLEFNKTLLIEKVRLYLTITFRILSSFLSMFLGRNGMLVPWLESGCSVGWLLSGCDMFLQCLCIFLYCYLGATWRKQLRDGFVIV